MPEGIVLYCNNCEKRTGILSGISIGWTILAESKDEGESTMAYRSAPVIFCPSCLSQMTYYTNENQVNGMNILEAPMFQMAEPIDVEATPVH